MTGRDLILYILSNHLEDEPVYKDGTFIGFYTPDMIAAKNNVGTGTVDAWAKMGYIDTIPIGRSYLIPVTSDFKLLK